VGYSKHTSFPTFTLKVLPPNSKQIEKEVVKDEKFTLKALPPKSKQIEKEEVKEETKAS
jgi:hypothetical protein